MLWFVVQEAIKTPTTISRNSQNSTYSNKNKNKIIIKSRLLSIQFVLYLRYGTVEDCDKMIYTNCLPCCLFMTSLCNCQHGDVFQKYNYTLLETNPVHTHPQLSCIHERACIQEVLMYLIRKMGSEISLLKLLPYSQGANKVIIQIQQQSQNPNTQWS